MNNNNQIMEKKKTLRIIFRMVLGRTHIRLGLNDAEGGPRVSKCRTVILSQNNIITFFCADMI